MRSIVAGKPSHLKIIHEVDKAGLAIAQGSACIDAIKNGEHHEGNGSKWWGRVLSEVEERDNMRAERQTKTILQKTLAKHYIVGEPWVIPQIDTIVYFDIGEIWYFCPMIGCTIWHACIGEKTLHGRL